MRNLILFSLFFFVSFSSCTQEKVDIQKALEFYEAINYQIGLKVAQQQKCIDELTKAILIVKENDDSLINTKGLEVLLKISTSINFAKKNSIENLTEFDTEINLKKKALDYYTSFIGAYKNEFPQLIHILSVPGKDRFERLHNLIFSKLKLIKEKEIVLKNAQEKFRAKYKRIKKLQTRIR